MFRLIYSLGLPQPCYVGQDDFEVLILLPQPSKGVLGEQTWATTVSEFSTFSCAEAQMQGFMCGRQALLTELHPCLQAKKKKGYNAV